MWHVSEKNFEIRNITVWGLWPPWIRIRKGRGEEGKGTEVKESLQKVSLVLGDAMKVRPVQFGRVFEKNMTRPKRQYAVEISSCNWSNIFSYEEVCQS